jgi:hypothetical protein
MRHPFADRDLVEFLVALPCALKVDPACSKALLKEALGDALPRVVRQRANKSDYMAVVRHRVDRGRCIERVRQSGVRLPHVDYAQLFLDAETCLESMPEFLLLNLARLHTFAAQATS